MEPQFGWYRGFVGIRPETEFQALFGAFCLVPREEICIRTEKAGGDGDKLWNVSPYPLPSKYDFTIDITIKEKIDHECTRNEERDPL